MSEIGLLHPGEMGAGIGASARESGAENLRRILHAARQRERFNPAYRPCASAHPPANAPWIYPVSKHSPAKRSRCSVTISGCSSGR